MKNKTNWKAVFITTTKVPAAIVAILVITTVMDACSKDDPDEEEPPYVELSMWQKFQQRVNSHLPGAYQEVDAMWKSYFPNTPKPEDLPTLDKSAVYYDAAKVLLEISDMWGAKATSDMNTYAVKCAQIFHEYYTKKSSSSIEGYCRFPHGLYYLYHQTDQQFYKEALEACALKTNWSSVNPVNERAGYARNVSYAICAYIAASKAELNIPNITTLLNHFVDMALSHLNQWHTGVLYNTVDNYRQPFIVGLTLNALTEYYERMDKDPRIPVAIQITLDDLWEQSWDIIDAQTPGGNYSRYTLGYGAFWYWADLVNGQWVNDINHMPTVPNLNPDQNMNLGSVYAWYARWLKENQPASAELAKSYMDKAVQIWEGYVVNGGMNRADLLWQGCRYVSDFVREYKRFHEL